MNKSIFAFILTVVCCVSPAFAQQAFDAGKLDRLFDVLESNNRMMGVVTVTRADKIIYQRSLGYRAVSDRGKVKADMDTKFRVGSVAKVFTAVMIYQLIEEKKLALDTRLSHFFPSLANADRITIAHLLSHTSGLADYTSGINHADPQSWVFRPHTAREMLARFAVLKPDFAPGEGYRYSNTNYTLLGYIIEAVTDSPYGEQLNKRIVKRIGLKRTRYGGAINPAKNEARSYVYDDGKWNQSYEEDLSVAAGAGGIVSTAPDLAKFIRALYEGKLVSRKSLEEMTTPFNDRYPDAHKGISLFKLRGINKDAISKQGGIDAFTADITYVPDDELAFALLINGHNYPKAKIFWSVMDIYYGRPAEIPSFKAVALAPEVLRQYTGVYGLKGGVMKITVSIDGTALSGQAIGQESFPLQAVNESTFIHEPSGIIVEFRRSPNGAVRDFVLYQGRNVSVWEKER
jgi:CubicO group peptidase (beta-lactamase class C family)